MPFFLIDHCMDILLGLGTWLKITHFHVLASFQWDQLHAFDLWSVLMPCYLYWCLNTNTSMTRSQPTMDRFLAAHVIGCYRNDPVLWRSGCNPSYGNAWLPTEAAIGLAPFYGCWIGNQGVVMPYDLWDQLHAMDIWSVFATHRD